MGGQYESATHGQFKSAKDGHFDRILLLDDLKSIFLRVSRYFQPVSPDYFVTYIVVFYWNVLNQDWFSDWLVS